MRKVPALPPAEERAVLRSFGRASFSSEWWRKVSSEMRHCSRCGGPLARRMVAEEGRKRYTCAACGFIAYQNPKVVAATLPVRGGKIYLLRRNIEPSKGLWTFPAGYLEMGETVEDAAVRETWEEIRARVRLTGAPRLYSYSDAGAVTVVYPAAVSGRPSPGPESQCVEAFSPPEIPWRELAFRSVFHALKDWVETPGVRG